MPHRSPVLRRLLASTAPLATVLLLACTTPPASPPPPPAPDLPPPVLQSPWGGVNPMLAQRSWPPFTALLAVASSHPDDPRLPGGLNVSPNRVYRLDYESWTTGP